MIDLSTADDHWVFDAIAKGSDDPQIWRSFLSRFQQPAFRVVRRSVRRKINSADVDELAEELWQSFFVTLLANNRRLLTRYRGDGGCTPRTYLCYLAGYHVLTELRTRRNIPDLLRGSFESMDDTEHPSPLASNDPSPVEVAASREVLREAMAGLDTLSDIDQRIFHLIYVENLPFKEIASITGATVQVVKSRIYEGLSRLRELNHER